LRGQRPRRVPSPDGGYDLLATVVSKELVQNGPLPSGPAPTGDFGRLQTRRSTTAPPPPAPIVKITLRLSERFRGNSTDSVVIQTDISDCAYPFEAGHEYLVFANEFQGNLTVNKCTATRPAKMAVATIQQLRALRDGTALPDLFGFAGTHPSDSSEYGWEQVEPVPGLTVTAQSERGDFRTQTADDGSYAFRGLPAGRYQVSVQPPERRLALWNGTTDHVGANAGLGDTCPVNFEVFYDGRISGTVARADGQPVSGFVFAEYEGPEKLNAAPVGSPVNSGHFEIGRLWPGLYRLVFQSNAQGPPPTRTIYYPGTQVASEATPIELGDGTQVDGLQFTIF
jgi:hypothetical protein